MRKPLPPKLSLGLPVRILYVIGVVVVYNNLLVTLVTQKIHKDAVLYFVINGLADKTSTEPGLVSVEFFIT